ncbi:hypothetical protein IMSHALPRED_009084 [Imshaugia aleurites]|uniref:Uncharacterized protein n=1 Tax=Imshaugia aleurites TaxID=172621 RepID=A0A8H3IM92_9LECA|nr:hypothetical protein IMSHALPRED_009084 [Imshaugia aleurites]
MSLFSAANSSGQSNMGVQHISREYIFSEPSLALLTGQQNLNVFQFDSLAGTNSRPVSTGHNNRTRIVEKRGCPQSPHLLWTLPQKRSNQSLTSGRVEGPEQCHPRAFSDICSAKRWKGSVTAPLPSPLSSVVTTRIPRPLLDFSEAKTVSLERTDSAEVTCDQTDCDRRKTLRSPFEYTHDFVTNKIDPNANNDIQRLDSNKPVHSKNSSGYIYYAPTNPSDAVSQVLDAHRRVPRRQLSYGDPPSKSGPRSLHKTTGSWELRQEAERYAEAYGLNSWLDSTSHASDARPYHSEPRSKPRLWLDLSEQKDGIQEAVSIPNCKNRRNQFQSLN